MPLCSVRERGKACPGGQLDTRPRAPRPCSLAYGPAWDTLTWFAVLIGMSSALNDMGVIRAFADAISGSLTSLGLGPLPLCALLNAAYFFVHYLFASQTAHVGALYAAYLSMMMGAGVPGLLAALALAYGSAINAAVTHYASGQVSMYFAHVLGQVRGEWHVYH